MSTVTVQVLLLIKAIAAAFFSLWPRGFVCSRMIGPFTDLVLALLGEFLREKSYAGPLYVTRTKSLSIVLYSKYDTCSASAPATASSSLFVYFVVVSQAFLAEHCSLSSFFSFTRTFVATHAFETSTPLLLFSILALQFHYWARNYN
jgi:hypothetical protein